MDGVRLYATLGLLLLVVAIALSFVAMLLLGIDAALSSLDDIINGRTRQGAALHPAAVLFSLSPTPVLAYAVLKLNKPARILALAILVTLILSIMI